MKRQAVLKPVVFLLGALLCSNVIGSDADSRYGIIPARNVFALQPPEEKHIETPAPPLPTVRLTGFSQRKDDRRAYFVVNSTSPGAQPELISLREGERNGGLELLKILDDEGEVRVRYGGIETTMTFKNEPPSPATLAPKSVSVRVLAPIPSMR